MPTYADLKRQAESVAENIPMSVFSSLANTVIDALIWAARDRVFAVYYITGRMSSILSSNE